MISPQSVLTYKGFQPGDWVEDEDFGIGWVKAIGDGELETYTLMLKTPYITADGTEVYEVHVTGEGVKPIDLTDEIIEAIGAQKMDESTYYWYAIEATGNEGEKEYFSLRPYILGHYIFNFSVGINHGYFCIKHVNELQQLLKVCNLTKPIIL